MMLHAIVSPRFSSRELFSIVKFKLRYSMTVFSVPVGTRLSCSLDKKSWKLFECSVLS